MRLGRARFSVTCSIVAAVVFLNPSARAEDGGSADCVKDVTKKLAELRRNRNERIARTLEQEESVAKVRELLSEMKDSDQGMRRLFIELVSRCAPNPRSADLSDFASAAGGLDSDNQAELKHIVRTKGWPVVSVYGAEADQAAFLVVQHADGDIEFQKEMLAVLEGLWPGGETGGEGYALLSDRVRHAQGLPQKYGSQGSCVDGVWQPYDMEDPAAVDIARRAVGLGTLAEYRKDIDSSRLCGG